LTNTQNYSNQVNNSRVKLLSECARQHLRVMALRQSQTLIQIPVDLVLQHLCARFI